MTPFCADELRPLPALGVTLIGSDRERQRYDPNSMGQQHAELSGASSDRDRTALIGSLVAAYAVFDALVLLIVIITLAAIFNPFLVFVGASVVVTIINVASYSLAASR